MEDRAGGSGREKREFFVRWCVDRGVTFCCIDGDRGLYIDREGVLRRMEIPEAERRESVLREVGWIDEEIEILPEEAPYRKRLEARRAALLRSIGETEGQMEMW